MHPVSSPLGRYSAIVAVVVVLLTIIAAIYGHTFGDPDSFVDNLAILAFGITIGTAGSLTMLNGTVAKVDTHEQEIRQIRATVANADTRATNADTRATEG